MQTRCELQSCLEAEWKSCVHTKTSVLHCPEATSPVQVTTQSVPSPPPAGSTSPSPPPVSHLDAS